MHSDYTFSPHLLSSVPNSILTYLHLYNIKTKQQKASVTNPRLPTVITLSLPSSS